MEDDVREPLLQSSGPVPTIGTNDCFETEPGKCTSLWSPMEDDVREPLLQSSGPVPTIGTNDCFETEPDPQDLTAPCPTVHAANEVEHVARDADGHVVRGMPEEVSDADGDVVGGVPEEASDVPAPVAVRKKGKGKGMFHARSFHGIGDSIDGRAVLHASVLIDDSKFRRHYEARTDLVSLQLYRAFHDAKVRALFRFCVLVNMGLAIFEHPAPATVALPLAATLPAELATLLVFAGQLCWIHQTIPSKKFWHDKKNYGVMVVIILTVLDIIGYTAGGWPFRLTRVLRPVFVSFNVKFIRRAYRDIRRSIKGMVDVVFLTFIVIGMFAMILTLLFLGTPEGKQYFPDLWHATLSLYVLETTANFPDVMMPVYKGNQWGALPFIVFVVIVTFILSSLILATVYNSYAVAQKREERLVFLEQRRKLGEAFSLLDPEGCGSIGRGVFTAFMTEHRHDYTVEHIELIWEVLVNSDLPPVSINGTEERRLVRKSFADLIDLLSLRITIRKPLSTDVNGALLFLRRVVQSKSFDNAVNSMLLVNIIIVVVDISVTFDEEDSIATNGQLYMGAVFLVEAGMRMLATGWGRYVESGWHKFDVVLIFLTLAGWGLHLFGVSTHILRYLLILRSLRVLTILGRLRRYRILVTSFLQLTPALATYSTVMFCLYYVYAIVGMEVFGGLVYKGNPKLLGTPYDEADYYANNFNSFANSFVTLFELTVVNNWHILTSGFVAVTSEVMWMYFISFHMIAVLVILSVVVAFVLDAFVVQWGVNQSDTIPAVERRARAASAAASAANGLEYGIHPRLNVRHFMRLLYWEEFEKEAAREAAENELFAVATT